jgi:hypothetical protein
MNGHTSSTSSNQSPPGFFAQQTNKLNHSHLHHSHNPNHFNAHHHQQMNAHLPTHGYNSNPSSFMATSPTSSDGNSPTAMGLNTNSFINNNQKNAFGSNLNSTDMNANAKKAHHVNSNSRSTPTTPTNNNNNSSYNYLDTNNNSVDFNKHLNNSIGGVINNLINSSLSHQPHGHHGYHHSNHHQHHLNPSAGFLLNNSSNPLVSAAAAGANFLLAANALRSTSGNPTLHTLNHMQQSSASNNHGVDDSKCHVCGDKSTGSHFGGIGGFAKPVQSARPDGRFSNLAYNQE